MKKLLLLLATAIAMIGTVPALATADYDYLCRVGHKSYPVSYDETEKTITWRGTVYHDGKLGEQGCKYEYVATNNGVTADLCMQTQGHAILTVGKDEFDCQMPKGRRR